MALDCIDNPHSLLCSVLNIGNHCTAQSTLRCNALRSMDTGFSILKLDWSTQHLWGAQTMCLEVKKPQTRLKWWRSAQLLDSTMAVTKADTTTKLNWGTSRTLPWPPLGIRCVCYWCLAPESFLWHILMENEGSPYLVTEIEPYVLPEVQRKLQSGIWHLEYCRRTLEMYVFK